MRAFTTAIRAPLACANRRKFGQNSVSASTTNSENAIAMLGNYGVTGWNDGLLGEVSTPIKALPNA